MARVALGNINEGAAEAVELFGPNRRKDCGLDDEGWSARDGGQKRRAFTFAGSCVENSLTGAGRIPRVGITDTLVELEAPDEADVVVFDVVEGHIREM